MSNSAKAFSKTYSTSFRKYFGTLELLSKNALIYVLANIYRKIENKTSKDC